MRGQALSAGTALTSGDATLSVTHRNRKKLRRAVTVQRSDGDDMTSAAVRTVLSTAAPSRSPTTISPTGRHSRNPLCQHQPTLFAHWHLVSRTPRRPVGAR